MSSTETLAMFLMLGVLISTCSAVGLALRSELRRVRLRLEKIEARLPASSGQSAPEEETRIQARPHG